jgi:hypothetical protein
LTVTVLLRTSRNIEIPSVGTVLPRVTVRAVVPVLAKAEVPIIVAAGRFTVAKAAQP